MKVRIDDIDHPQKLDLYELRHMYKNNVCGTICDFALSMMTVRELRRYLAIAIYKHSIQYKSRQRTSIILKISILLSISIRTIEKLCPSSKNKPCKNLKTGAQEKE